jgi:hypothetical protein
MKKTEVNTPHSGYCQRHEEMYFDIDCPKCRLEREQVTKNERLKYFKELGKKWDEKGWWEENK